MRIFGYKEFLLESLVQNSIPDYDQCLALCNMPDSPFYEVKTTMDDYQISMFNYRLAENNDFLLPGAKEMRGITFVFDIDSQVFKRFILLEKFFNLNQVPETMYSVVNKYKIKYVNEKEDGSIASFIQLPNGRVVGKSKMSLISDQATRITHIYNTNPDVKKFVDWCLSKDIVPIFEYVGPSNRVVLRYWQEELILLRLRNNKTGRHLDLRDYLDKIGTIKIAPFIDDLRDLDDLIEKTTNLKDKEGWVIQAEDDAGKDFFFKLKTPWYVQRHGLLTEDIHRENIIIGYILEDKIDDVLGQIPEEEVEARNKIYEIVKIVKKALREKESDIIELYNEFVSLGQSKKDFALKYLRHPDFGLVMALINGNDIEEIVKKWLWDKTKRLEMAREWLSSF